MAKLSKKFPHKGDCPLTPDIQEIQNTFKMCSWALELISLWTSRSHEINRGTGLMAHNSFPISFKILMLHKYIFVVLLRTTPMGIKERY